LESIEEVNVLFEKVKSYKRSDANLGKEYQGYLQEVCLNLKKTFEQSDAPKSMLKVEMLKSKFFLLDVCFEKAI
jgi:hypothetical protein